MSNFKTALICATILPGALRAEGARVTFDCTVGSICDVASACIEPEIDVTFVLEPVALDAAGAGDWTISYADSSYPMTGSGPAGPFVWEDRFGILTMTPQPGDNPVQVTIHSDYSSSAETDTTAHLTCEVTQ